MTDDRERDPGEAANLNTTAATPPREGVPNDPRLIRGAEPAGVAGAAKPADPAAEAPADRDSFDRTELSEAEEDVAPPGVETGGPSGTMPVGPGEGPPAG